MALFAKEIRGLQWWRNMIVVTVANFIGTAVAAIFFGYFSGALQGDFAARTIAVAQGRVIDTPMEAFLSGIACNVLVSTGVYMNMAAKDFIGKIVGTLLPVSAFVLAGYQHVVANMFLVLAGILAGGVTWAEYIENIFFVWIGNFVGGGLLLAGMYYTAFKVGTKETEATVEKLEKIDPTSISSIIVEKKLH